MPVTPLQKKLRLQEEQKILILNPPQGYLDLLEPLPQGSSLSKKPGKDCDFVQLFVKDRLELDAWIDAALQSVRYDGLLWLSYPKGTSKVKTDINRDILWVLLSSRGIRPVAMISIDETWSAMRFRPAAEVKS